MKRLLERGKRMTAIKQKIFDELMELKRQTNREKEEFEKEYKELGKFIEENRQKLEAEDNKEDCNDSFHSYLTSCSSNDSTTMNNTSSNSRSSRKKLDSIQQQDRNFNKNDQSKNVNLRLSKDQLQEYEKTFQTIKEATGFDNIDDMITKYLENEKLQFSLFSYISHHNGEIAKLEREIELIQNDIVNETCKEQSLDAKHERQMKEEEQRKKDLKRAKVDYECKFNSNFKLLKDLDEELVRIDNMIPADSFESSSNTATNACTNEEKAEGTNATIKGVFRSLGSIESKISTFLNETNTNSATISTATERRGSLFPNKIDLSLETLLRSYSPSVPPISLPTNKRVGISIYPPSSQYSSGEEEEYSNRSKDEESERPFTLDELRQSTMVKIQQKRYSKKVLLKHSRR